MATAMDRREVAEKNSTLQKALSSSVPAANIVGLLKEVQKGVRPTEELLRSTQIGKTVNRFKQHKAPEVARLASEIVSKWRHLVHEQKLANGGSSGSGTPNARANGTASPAPPKAAPPPPKAESTVPPDKRTWKTDKISKDDLTSDQGRNNCIGLIYDGLCQNSTNPSKEVLEIAKAVEEAALDLPTAKQDSGAPAYREKIRSLYQNLKNKSNPELKVRVLSGEITPKRLVTMTHEELKSQEQRAVDAAIIKENMNNAMVAQEMKSVSTSLQCGKCGQKKVSYSQAQTRSADEPMTTFCECLVCGNRWKFS
jgi:transcription elongation factor S-II